MMSIRRELSILCARTRETMKHFVSNAHYFNPTRSMKENKKRKHKAKKAATDERMATLEKISRHSRTVRRNAPRNTIDINNTGPVSCTCCRFSGRVSGLW